MSLRKLAGLAAGFALAVGLIGAGVSASFTDSVKAQENINVGTFQCKIVAATPSGASDGIAVDGKSVTYTAPTIESSAPGSAPFSFTVQNTGSIADVLTVATSPVSAPWSIINAPFVPVPLAAGASHVYNTGVSWTELDNSNLGQSGTVTWTVSCNENGPTAIFDNTPTVVPASLASYGAEAYSFNEWGGGVTFAGSARKLSTAKVIMNSWACESGSWTVPFGTAGACVTTPGTTYSVPITFNVYNVATGNTVGSLIASVTQTFAIPYRPSSIAGNDGKGWNLAGNHGYNVPITFTFSGQTLPDTAIFGITYQTTSSGYPALGAGNHPSDSLNIATYPANDVATQAVVGTWLPDDTHSYVGVRGTSTMIGNAAVANMPTGSGDNFVSYMPAVEISASY
jgi:predicted ribosomally synthesized peptide with SipW-like signal peptide